MGWHNAGINCSEDVIGLVFQYHTDTYETIIDNPQAKPVKPVRLGLGGGGGGDNNMPLPVQFPVQPYFRILLVALPHFVVFHVHYIALQIGAMNRSLVYVQRVLAFDYNSVNLKYYPEHLQSKMKAHRQSAFQLRGRRRVLAASFYA
jgi:hypothetical protein